MTPPFYGIKNGIYQKDGIDLEIIPTSSGAVATEAIIAGTYEIGKGSAIGIFQAYLKGLPIRIIGNGPVWDAKTPFSMMIVASDSTAKTGADFNGKTLASAALGDMNEMAMNAWIDQNGGDSKTIRWIEIPNSAAGDAVAAHRCEATMLQEPALGAAIQTGKVRAFAPAYSAIAPHFSTALYFVQTTWGAQHADLIKRFLTATYTAAAMTNDKKFETAAMMSEITKIPLSVYQTMPRPNNSTKSDPALVQPLIDMAAKYKTISSAFPAKDIFLS